jgi:hypothetical protein
VLVSRRGLFSLDAEEADGGVETMRVNFNAVVAVVACVILATMALADRRQVGRLASVKACTIDAPDLREVMRGHKKITKAHNVPGVPNARVVVQSMERGVVYLDEAGNVLASRRTGRFEWCEVSPDGGILAFMGIPTSGATENLPTERRPVQLRVEKATGELVWERKDGLGVGETTSCLFSVTDQGYVVVHPNVHPPGYSTTIGRIARPLIFGPKGELIAELPVRFYDGTVALSRDGVYCAINFADLDAEGPAECLGGRESARQCLALFEVMTGRELWRHYFSQCESGFVALTEGARRVVCGAREAKWVPDWYMGLYSVYIFDREGKVTSRVDTKGPCGRFVLSPNEESAAFSVSGSGSDEIVALNTEDGAVGFRWSCEPVCDARVSSVSDSATAAVTVTTWHRLGEASTRTYRWILIGRTGVVIHEEPYEEENPPYVLLDADGKTVCKIWKGGMEQYVLEEQ